MQYGTDMKIAAYVGPNSATLAIKKKNGLLFTIGDTNLNGNSTAFTGYIGNTFSSIQFKKQGKKWLVKITEYEGNHPKVLEMYAKTQSQYQRFVSTDYHGFKLKHQ